MTGRTTVLVVDQADGFCAAQQHLLRVARPLAERGVDLVLAAPRNLELAKAWTARGLRLVDVALPVRRRAGADARAGRVRPSPRALTHQALDLVRRMRAIRRTARAVRADVIQATGTAARLDVVLGGWLAHRPVVLLFDGDPPAGSGQLRRSMAITGAARTIAGTGALAAALPARLGRRVVVIPDGVDVREFSPGPADPMVRKSLGAAPDEILLVALTRLDPEQRVEDLITALAPLVDRPGWHLAVVGSTSSHQQYAQGVQKMGDQRLGNRITFIGECSSALAVLRASDVLVHSGTMDQRPQRMREAQACGRPVVAYAVPGMPQAVLDRVTGLLAPPGAVAELGALMTAVVLDAKLRQELGRAAREYAVARHSVDVQADVQSRLIKRLVEQLGTGPAPHRSDPAAQSSTRRGQSPRAPTGTGESLHLVNDPPPAPMELTG